MYNIFSDTGIQFQELPWTLPFTDISKNYGENLAQFLYEGWTLISLDASPRDYARLFWRPEEGDSRGTTLRPVLAVDTRLYQPAKDDINHGFLTKSDGGLDFKSKTFSNVMPEKADPLHLNWIDHICRERNIPSSGVFEAYKRLIAALIKGEHVVISGTERHIIETYGNLGGFEFQIFDEEDASINTNLYIDLGNSRTTAIVYEDHSLEAFGLAPFKKVELLNYRDYFGLKAPGSKSKHDSVFPSLLQFRSSPIPSMSSTETFKLISIASIGEEARLYKTERSLETDGRFSGMSSPKRYLWDNDLFEAEWKFANKEDKIKGEILRYITPEDTDEDSEDGLENPLNAQFCRRTLVIHFLVELIEQTLRSINSYEFRRTALPEQPRVLKRIVLSFPTAFSPELINRLKKQANKALNIIRRHYAVSSELILDLGADEGSTVQCILIQNYMSQGGINHYRSMMRQQTYLKDPKKTRFASIDIGGGTTDVMISEFDATDEDQEKVVKGEILFSDGMQFGGDEILQKLIAKAIFPCVEAAFSDTQTIQTVRDVLTSTDTNTRHLRMGAINFLLYPLAIYAISNMINPRQRDVFEGVPAASLYETMAQHVYDTIGYQNQTESLASFKEALNFFQEGLGNNFLDGDKVSLTLSRNEIEESIRTSELMKTYIKRYAAIFNQYSPSFILLTGKLSELPVIREELQKSLFFSPERILPVSEMKVGRWYPYRRGDKMEDAKTTVVVGMAIADITEHATHVNGLGVQIREGNSNKTTRYYSDTSFVGKLFDDIILLKEGEDVTGYIRLTGNKIRIFGCKIYAYPVEQNDYFGSLHYELFLEAGYIVDPENRPKLKLKRTEAGLEIDESSISGNVYEGNRDSVPVPAEVKHIRLLPKNIQEEFFLDSGRLF